MYNGICEWDIEYCAGTGIVPFLMKRVNALSDNNRINPEADSFYDGICSVGMQFLQEIIVQWVYIGGYPNKCLH